MEKEYTLEYIIERLKKNDEQTARCAIVHQIKYEHPDAMNVINLILKAHENKWGKPAADKLINELKLDILFGIIDNKKGSKS